MTETSTVPGQSQVTVLADLETILDDLAAADPEFAGESIDRPLIAAQVTALAALPLCGGAGYQYLWRE